MRHFVNFCRYFTCLFFFMYFSMTHGFIINNFTDNLHVFYVLTTYKSYNGTKTETKEKYKIKIEKQR